jgi:hypothetical protein
MAHLSCYLCPNVSVKWQALSREVWDRFVDAITTLDALEIAVKDKRKAWKAQKASMERQVSALDEQLGQLDKKRRLYSWQQAEGIITEVELVAAYKQLKSEEALLRTQIERFVQFKSESPPPDKKTFNALAEYWSGEMAYELIHATDEMRDKFAQLFDLQVTIRPGGSPGGYAMNLYANIPLEATGDKPGAYDMVFSPSGRGQGDGAVKRRTC